MLVAKTFRTSLNLHLSHWSVELLIAYSSFLFFVENLKIAPDDEREKNTTFYDVIYAKPTDRMTNKTFIFAASLKKRFFFHNLIAFSSSTLIV